MAPERISGTRPRVDDYLLLEEIGSGPRGIVYLAEKDARRVAFKILHSGISVDRKILERFVSGSPEQIRHPNLAPLHTVGETQEGIYYAMRLFRGDVLEHILSDLRRGSGARPTLSPLAVGPGGEIHPSFLNHAVRLVAEAAEGLEKVHRENIFHFRLSPRNLAFSAAGRLVITDFGARGGGLDAEEAKRGRRYHYLAPEQLATAKRETAAPADVYALGAILFELLTLQTPVAPGSPAQQRSAVTKGRVRSPREFRSDIPIALEDCVLKALSTEPEKRYPSAGALAADLRRFLDGEPVEARRQQISRKSRKPGLLIGAGGRPSRTRRWQLVAALVLFLFVTVAYVYRENVSRDKKNRQLAAIELVNEGDYDEAVRASERLLSFDPGNPLSLAVHQNAALSAAAEHLSVAMSAMTSDPDLACSELEKAKDLLPESGSLVELYDQLYSRLVIDPVVRGLGDRSSEVRLQALRQLQDDLSDRRRPPSDVALARSSLLDPAPDIRSLSFSIFTLAHSSDLLLETLSLRCQDLPCRVDANSFLLLYQTLAAMHDSTARDLLSQWTLDFMEELDSLGPGEAFTIPPGFEVEMGHDWSQSFTATWIRVSAASSPEALLSEIPRLRSREELAPLLVDAMAELGTPSAVEVIAHLANEHYLVVGVRCVRALARLHAIPAIVELLDSSLPLEMRLKALEFGGTELASGARPQLARLVETSPEPAIREKALSLLAWSPETEDWDPSRTLLLALDDQELRDGALLWLEQLGEDRRIDLGFQLLGHHDPATRRRAIEWVALAGPRCVPETVLKLFHPRGTVRQAALEVLRRLEHRQRGIEVFEGVLARLSHELEKQATKLQARFSLLLEQGQRVVENLDRRGPETRRERP